MSYEAYVSGQRLVSAVERMLEPSEAIIALVLQIGRESGACFVEQSRRIISHYSNRSALVGGSLALPGLVPGAGTLVAAVGTTLADMALVLKFEVEMCLALSCLHGYDIRRPEERQLAFLLAAVKTHEVESGRNILLDIGAVSSSAFWSYAPREVSKMLLRVCGAIALAYAARSLTKAVLRAIPLVGVGVGAGLNKVLTTRVGEQAHRELTLRRQLGRGATRRAAI